LLAAAAVARRLGCGAVDVLTRLFGTLPAALAIPFGRDDVLEARGERRPNIMAKG